MDAAARVEAVKARLEHGRGAVLQTAASGRACRDCRYFKNAKAPTCENPVYLDYRRNVVDGAINEEGGELVEQARSDKGLCGPEALLFDNPPRLRTTEHVTIGIISTLGVFAFADEVYGALASFFP